MWGQTKGLLKGVNIGCTPRNQGYLILTECYGTMFPACQRTVRDLCLSLPSTTDRKSVI